MKGFVGQVTTFGVGGHTTIRAVDVRDRGVQRHDRTSGHAGRRGRPVSAHPRARPLDERAGGNRRGARIRRAASGAIAEHGGDAARGFDVAARSRDWPKAWCWWMTRTTRALRRWRVLSTPWDRTREASRRVAVIGEMRELGEFATVLHRESGRQRRGARGGPAGGHWRPSRRGAGRSGRRRRPRRRLRSGALRPATTQPRPVAAMLRAGDVVLVKGSRGTRTDVVADRVKAEWG